MAFALSDSYFLTLVRRLVERDKKAGPMIIGPFRRFLFVQAERYGLNDILKSMEVTDSHMKWYWYNIFGFKLKQIIKFLSRKFPTKK